MKMTVKVVFVVCLAILLSSGAAAQNTVTITGIVTDPSGAVVPDAQVQMTKVDTGAVRSTQTGADGTYLFSALPIGPYTLQVTKEGFSTYTRSGIVLQVGTNPAIPVTLQLGNVSQTVEVSANAAMVETQNTGVGQVIQPEQIIELPLNGRQVSQLVALAGAAVDVQGSGGIVTSLNYPSAVSISLAGNQPNATNYLLDGSANMDYRSNVGAPLPFPDALNEFKVNSSAVPANEGSRPGGAVNAVTKSGTNVFHGNVFEFLRNGAVNAQNRTFPDASGAWSPGIPDNLKRNQFGGTIGGPIKRDKLFFFYGYQGTRTRQNLPPQQLTVPTPATLQGNFVDFLSSACGTPRNLPLMTPAMGGVPAQRLLALDGNGKPIPNVIDPAWLNTPSAKMAAAIAAHLPTPDNLKCGTLTVSQYQPEDEYQHVGRLDWQRNDKDTLFGRYFIADYNRGSPYDPNSRFKLLSDRIIGLEDRVQNASFGDTYVINPQMVSSFRIYYGRTAVQRISPSSLPNLCDIGRPFNADITCMNPRKQIWAYTFNIPTYPGWVYTNNLGISENIGWQVRSHRLEFGFSGQRIEMNGNGVFQTNPVLNYSNGSTSVTGTAIGDFVTGNISRFTQGNGQLSRDYQYLPSAYIHDNWRISRTFQLSVGVRWDPFLAQVNKYGMASNFSMERFLANEVSKVYPKAPPGVTFPGDPGFHGKSNTKSHPYQFSPRLGLVWDPAGNGTQTIRAGYGLFYDTSMMWNTMHVVLNWPWGSTLVFQPAPVNLAGPNQGGGLVNPFYGLPGGNPFPTPLNPPSGTAFPLPSLDAKGQPVTSGADYVFQDPNIEPQNVQQWNLSYQRQVAENWLIGISYVGNKTTHSWVGNALNPSIFITSSMTPAQYPGIVDVSKVNGTSGPCTLKYGGQNVTLNPCNSSSSASEAARRKLNLLNPNLQGGGMFGPGSAATSGGGLAVLASNGSASYNGLLLSVQHRFSNGYSLSSNYTWSHCLNIDDVGQDVSNAFQDPSNTRGSWGNCGYDRRHLLNLSLVLQSPKIGTGWVQKVTGNWNASGIFTVGSGQYMTVTSGTDTSYTGVFLDRPNQVADPFTAGTVAANPTCVAPSKVHTSAAWFNPCAFVRAPAGTYGNTARNSLLGPGRWNFDAALWRTFDMTERLKLNARVEGFNVFNHPNLGNPATNLNGGTPGLITSTSSAPRILQLALKVTF